MFNGVLALLTRSLRQDARLQRHHLFRGAFCVVMYFGLLSALATSAMRGAPGLDFFSSISAVNVIFITCAGLGYFATAITEEKEEEVLGLLMMAGLNPLAILLGKSTSRLIQSALLLMLQLPFTLLSITLGGVTFHQVFAAYLALFAYLVLVANLALLWSTLCERSGSAAGLTSILVVLYCVLPPSASALLAQLQTWRPAWGAGTWVVWLLEQCTQTCVFYRLPAIMSTGYAAPLVSVQVVADLCGGVIAFGLAWLVFLPAMGRAARGGARPAERRQPLRRRWLSPGRVWAMPLVWKEFYFSAGGSWFFVFKLAGVCALTLGLLTFSEFVPGTLDGEAIAILLFQVITLTSVGELCVTASRLFHDELRRQTLSSLMVLPRSLGYLAYSKVLGAVLGAGSTLIFLVPVALFVTIPSLDQLLNSELLGLGFTLVIFLHLIVLISLFVKWGALPLAIVMMVPITACCPVWSLMMVVRMSVTGDMLTSVIANLTVVGVVCTICLVFQLMIGARLQELSAGE